MKISDLKVGQIYKADPHGCNMTNTCPNYKFIEISRVTACRFYSKELSEKLVATGDCCYSDINTNSCLRIDNLIPLSIADIVGKKIAVHCPTEEEAGKFLRMVKDAGGEWGSGKVAGSHTNWNDQKNATCYSLIGGLKEMGFAWREFYEEEGDTVIPFEAFPLKLTEHGKSPSWKFYGMSIDMDAAVGGRAIVLDAGNGTRTMALMLTTFDGAGTTVYDLIPKIEETTAIHPDIGKRVKWRDSFLNTAGTGTLLAVDCDKLGRPHLVRREDGKGFAFPDNQGARELGHWINARKQGVGYEAKDLFWVSSYTVIESQATDMATVDISGAPTTATGSLFELHSKYFQSEIIKNPLSFNQKLMGNLKRIKDAVRGLMPSVRRRREYGIEDDSGSRTESGTDLLLDMLYSEKLPEIDKKLEEDEKAEKDKK